MSSALPWAGTAAIIASASTLIAHGHDGLAIQLGLAGATFLWVTLLAPVASAMSKRDTTPAEALAHAFGSPALGTALRMVLLFAAAILLAADLQIAAAGIDLIVPGRGAGLFAAIAAVLAGALLLPLLTGAWLDNVCAAVFGLVALLIVSAVAILVWQQGPAALISVPAVPDIAAIEQHLLEKRLADPAMLRAHTVPFLKSDALNFAALASLIGLGFAAAAIGHGGLGNAPDVNRRAAVMVLALLMLLPAVVAHGKRELLAAFDSGIKVSAPPGWLSDHAASGFLDLCGKSPALTAGMPPRVSDLCGKGAGREGLLRWQDANYTREGLSFAALDAAGAPRSATAALVLAALLAGAVLAARTVSVLGPVRHGRYRRTIAAGVAVLAGLIALARVADVAALLSLAATIAAAGVIPAAVGAVTFRTPSPAAALLAMTAGIVLATGLSLAPRLAPFTAFEASGASQAAPPSITRRLATLRDQIAAAPAGPGREAAALQARRIAEERVAWLGLKPIASGLWGVLLGIVIVILGTAISRIAVNHNRN